MMAGRPLHLVTGALGFVGLHLVEQLLGEGGAVAGLGRHGPADPLPGAVRGFAQAGAAASLPRGVRFEGDAGAWDYAPCALEDPAPVRQLVEDLRPAVIFHLAAQSSAARSFTDPQDTFQSNVIGTLNLLEAVRFLPETERPTLVMVGSAEEYGRLDATGPVAEDHPVRPVSPYGASKAAQTLLCQQYHRAFALPVVVTRSFSHTGPGQDARFALPSFARQIAAAERGEGPRELSVGDLSPVRDYLDVRDVAVAYRRLAEAGVPGEVYNVASGRGVTIRAALQMLLDRAQVPLTVRTDPQRLRPADIPYLVGSAARLERCTGWRPARRLEDTLAELLDDVRKEHS
ncbi:MAG: GDP-mannose 4,6-dehydratase [Candidatus Krumholzibacteriia bacterium]